MAGVTSEFRSDVGVDAVRAAIDRACSRARVPRRARERMVECAAEEVLILVDDEIANVFRSAGLPEVDGSFI